MKINDETKKERNSMKKLVKNWEWHSSSSLASCLTMSLLRPLLSAHDFQMFIHMFSFDCILLTAFLASFHECFWKQKQEHNCVQCGHGNLAMPSNF